MYVAHRKLERLAYTWLGLAICGFCTLIFDVFSFSVDAPLLIYLSLKMAPENYSTKVDTGVIGTPAISIVLTGLFSILALVPFMLRGFIKKSFTVNSTAKVSSWIFFLSDCFIVLGVLATLMAILYLSGTSEGAIIICVVIHLVWGAGTYLLARFTWT